jgi:hypothetical protein
VHVAAWMYWWQKRDPLSDLDGYTAAMDKYHGAIEDAASATTYVYVTTPWTRDGVFGGVDEKIRVARNTCARNWLLSSATSSASGGAGAVRRMLLDYSGIAGLKKFPKTRDEIHYMCIWTKKLPDLVTAQKYVPENKCVDRVNAAVSQMLVHLLAQRL